MRKAMISILLQCKCVGEILVARLIYLCTIVQVFKWRVPSSSGLLGWYTVLTGQLSISTWKT